MHTRRLVLGYRDIVAVSLVMITSDCFPGDYSQ